MKRNAKKTEAVKAMEKFDRVQEWLKSMGYTAADRLDLTAAECRRQGRFESANLMAEHVHSLLESGEVTPFHRGLPYDDGNPLRFYPEHL